MSGRLSLLTPDQMADADRAAIKGGPFDGYGLMRNAGLAIHRSILARFPRAGRIAVLCGPGNNGGDGYVVARLLAEDGIAVSVHALAPPRAGTDADLAAREWKGRVLPLAGFRPDDHDLVVDALFGAGLDRDVTGDAAAAIGRVNDSGLPVVAVDLPSGISGSDGSVLGRAFRASLTVTFFRRKPGHLLQPGRSHCGDVVVADIGIPDAVLSSIKPLTWANSPDLWRSALPVSATDTHKYARGSVGVFSGGPSATGAARLSAMAAARSGAGAVTVLSPASAMLVNAAHLTSIMLARCETVEELDTFAASGRTPAWVIGPGFGPGDRLREFVLRLLGTGATRGIVLDADVFTTFRDNAAMLLEASRKCAAETVMTPHEGEFSRLWPELDGAPGGKLERARIAANRSGSVIVLKGSDTVIAAPDGRATINENGSPVLATAGSGDVLAGCIAGLVAQGMPAWEAACAAVWLHAEAGNITGFGAMAEDLAANLPAAFARSRTAK